MPPHFAHHLEVVTDPGDNPASNVRGDGRLRVVMMTLVYYLCAWGGSFQKKKGGGNIYVHCVFLFSLGLFCIFDTFIYRMFHFFPVQKCY